MYIPRSQGIFSRFLTIHFVEMFLLFSSLLSFLPYSLLYTFFLAYLLPDLRTVTYSLHNGPVPYPGRRS